MGPCQAELRESLAMLATNWNTWLRGKLRPCKKINNKLTRKVDKENCRIFVSDLIFDHANSSRHFFRTVQSADWMTFANLVGFLDLQITVENGM